MAIDWVGRALCPDVFVSVEARHPFQNQRRATATDAVTTTLFLYAILQICAWVPRIDGG